MAKPVVLRFPTPLKLVQALCFLAELHELPVAEEYEFDAGTLGHVSPFGMLLIGAALRQFRARLRESTPHAKCRVRNVEPTSYASHMGLWHSFGAREGNEPGQAIASDRYIPIRELPVSSIKSAINEYRWPVSQAVEPHAIQVAEVLAQGVGDVIENTLCYAIREVFRNVVEHSEAASIWYCAQYWPSSDRVELAVLDEGKGILASLRENPDILLPDESSAVHAATALGVSRHRMANAQWRDAAGTPHENAGCGLYVIRELTRHAGSMFILSNNDGVHFQSGGTAEYATSFRGTAVRVSLQPSRLGGLLDRILADVNRSLPDGALTPSMLSRLPKP